MTTARDWHDAPVNVRTAVLAYAAWNRRDYDAAVPALDESRTGSTRAAMKLRLQRVVAVFPDFRITDVRAYDLEERVVVRFRVTGTHRGSVDDLSPTGRRIDIEMLDLIQFDTKGRVVGVWNLFDQTMLKKQLGSAVSA